MGIICYLNKGFLKRMHLLEEMGLGRGYVFHTCFLTSEVISPALRK